MKIVSKREEVYVVETCYMKNGPDMMRTMENVCNDSLKWYDLEMDYWEGTAYPEEQNIQKAFDQELLALGIPKGSTILLDVSW